MFGFSARKDGRVPIHRISGKEATEESSCFDGRDSNNFDGTMRVAENGFRCAPDQKSIDTPATMGAHEDYISRPLHGLLEDGGFRITLFSDRMCLETYRSQLLRRTFRQFFPFFQPLLLRSLKGFHLSHIAVRNDEERNGHVEYAHFRVWRTTACAAASENLESSTASKIFMDSILSPPSKLHESKGV